MLYLSGLFLFVVLLLGYALMGDKGKNTIHARKGNFSVAQHTEQSIRR